jgi:hypothetical protein
VLLAVRELPKTARARPDRTSLLLWLFCSLGRWVVVPAAARRVTGATGEAGTLAATALAAAAASTTTLAAAAASTTAFAAAAASTTALAAAAFAHSVLSF